MQGVVAELVFGQATDCPVASASAEVSGELTEVTWTGAGEEAVTEQVVADADADVPFEPVFDYGDRRVYEFERDGADPCVCESIQQTLGPVSDVYARAGELHVKLHAPDVAALRDLVTDLRERFGTVGVEYLARSVEADDDTELVPIDLRRLTDRQREVLETAHEMGYFEYPRDANATAVATELGIELSTFAEHLAAAQGKLLEELLGPDST